jgi:TolB-like protein/class 3 adenylate cyclase/Flp pilus assembly protein TadD
MPRARRLSPTAQLPTGTLTFLFTDIEGSTRLWEAHPDAMHQAVARHDTLVRQNIEARSGLVFKTMGDAFCAAFGTAPEALAAALGAQQALYAERWPEAVRIRARMALHTGAIESRDGDYFGPPLNHVARLLAIGHGGQTLVSKITYDLCRDRLPSGAALKSLGEHGLKDMARRESVFQLCHADLPQAFPPLKTLRAPLDESVPSIAVLPFVNMSRDEENEYFADGLAEELLNVLSKIRGLRVASRTSAFHFKGKDVDIPTVAQKLNVATVLEGSVRKAGKRVRITAQLVEVATDSHLWSETYDRELDDIFAVQDDIAQSVVKELRSALLGHKAAALANATVKEEVQAASRGRGDNVEAYRLYLQGRFWEDRFTREGSARALEYYRRALEIDPAYGLACAGVARVYCDQAGASWLPIAEGFSKAREAAQRALELDPDLAEAHAAMGGIRIFYDWDWQGADESLRRALELAPGNARILRSAAIVARSLGRQQEAIELLRRAATLDPLGAPVHRTLALACHAAGLLDEAEAAATKALELNPHDARSRFWLGLTLLARGRLDEAQAAFEHEVHDDLPRLLGLALVHHASGRDADSRAALQALVEKDPDGSAYQIAEGYAGRGETDLCFEWLDRAYHQHDAGLTSVKLDPLFDSVRGDPRWQPFLRKMKLAD